MGAVDEKKIDMAIDKGFGFFDKDKSGFVEGAEAAEAAQKVLNMIGGPAKVSVSCRVQQQRLRVLGVEGRAERRAAVILMARGLLAGWLCPVEGCLSCAVPCCAVCKANMLLL